MKKITQEDFEIIVGYHYLWLEEDPKGKRADLSFTDCTELDFSSLQLLGRSLRGAAKFYYPALKSLSGLNLL